jgi:hypothetical protein
LQPLANIRPGLILPGQTQTVEELATNVENSGVVVPFMDEW